MTFWQLFRGSNEARAFSRRWWLGAARSAFWVILTTVLIWVYADIEYTDTTTLTVNVVLDTGASQSLMLLSPEEHTVTFEASGSKSSLKQLADDLAEGGSVLHYDVSQEYTPDDEYIPADVIVRQAAELRRRGIELTTVTPKAIRIELDRLIRVTDVPVILEYTGAELVLLPEPKTVTIRVPQSQWNRLPESLRQNPRLRTLPQDLSAVPAGKTVNVTAAVSPLLDDVRVDVQPQTVTFPIQIKSRTVTEELTLTVKILCPAAWTEAGETTWQQYELVRPSPADWRVNLTLIGPKKDIKPENVQAFVVLTENDKKPVESWLERDVHVRFSPETNLKLATPSPRVKFRLEKRNPLTTLP